MLDHRARNIFRTVVKLTHDQQVEKSDEIERVVLLFYFCVNDIMRGQKTPKGLHHKAVTSGNSAGAGALFIDPSNINLSPNTFSSTKLFTRSQKKGRHLSEFLQKVSCKRSDGFLQW